MSKMTSGRLYRTLNVTLKPKESDKRLDSAFYVEGYATTFEPYVLYEDDKGQKIYEHFTKECFKNTDMSDIIFQFDHEGKVYARMSNNTLIVEADEKGLFIAADLSKSPAAQELYGEIEAELITKMSWGFRPGLYSYDKKARTIRHKSVKKIFDVSAVSIPANGDTEINARRFADGVICKAIEESEKRRKTNLKIKLELERRTL